MPRSTRSSQNQRAQFYAFYIGLIGQRHADIDDQYVIEVLIEQLERVWIVGTATA